VVKSGEFQMFVPSKGKGNSLWDKALELLSCKKATCG
jgi:hypothetical protein